MIAASRLPSRLPAQLLGVTIVLLAIPGAQAGAVLAGLAIAAALVAHHERRVCSLQLATAIAAASAPVGLAVLPLMLGASLRHRQLASLPLAALAAGAARLLVGGWPVSATIPTLYDCAVAIPVTAALIAATAMSVAGWIVATAASRHVDGRTILATIGLAAFVPFHPVALIAPAILLLGLPHSSHARLAAANDDKPLGSLLRIAA